MKNVNDEEKKNVMKIDTISLDDRVDKGTFFQDKNQFDEEVSTATTSPAQRGGNAVSGSQPDVESDDDVLENAHQVGIAVNEDLENPTELNIAQDVQDAEELRRKK
jgi:hypothetical protein